jgi:hypothetical protein
MGQKCCICSGPPAVLENVDRMLRNKTPMSRIAALAGCSKSAVGRHSLACLPKKTLQEHGAALHRRRLVVQQGNPPIYHLAFSGRSLAEHQLDFDRDLFLVVSYGNKGGSSPKMLTHEEAQALTEKMEASNKAAKENAEENKDSQRTFDSPAPEIIAPGEQVTDS